MKKLILIILCVCFCFIGAGCENETKLQAGHISDITGAQSTSYAIKVVLDDDDRINEKYVDLQISSSKDEQLLKFYEELGEEMTICLPKKEYWYNLTYLISKANGTAGEGGYKVAEDYGNRVFNFVSQNDVGLKFRLVAGQKKGYAAGFVHHISFRERIG